MKFGKDFFLWFKAIIEIVKVLIGIFGDESDQDEAKKNGFANGTNSLGK